MNPVTQEAELGNVTGAKKELNSDRTDLEREEAELDNVAEAETGEALLENATEAKEVNPDRRDLERERAGAESAQVNPEGLKAQLILGAGAEAVAETAQVNPGGVKAQLVLGAGAEAVAETAQVNPGGVKAQLQDVAGAVAEDVIITMNPVKKIVVNLVGT